MWDPTGCKTIASSPWSLLARLLDPVKALYSPLPQVPPHSSMAKGHIIHAFVFLWGAATPGRLWVVLCGLTLLTPPPHGRIAHCLRLHKLSEMGGIWLVDKGCGIRIPRCITYVCLHYEYAVCESSVSFFICCCLQRGYIQCHQVGQHARPHPSVYVCSVCGISGRPDQVARSAGLGPPEPAASLHSTHGRCIRLSIASNEGSWQP